VRYKYKHVYSWAPYLAYIVGLIAADGCLSGDKRHVDFTSKDRQLVELYRDLIRPAAKIGVKRGSKGRSYFRVQIGDVGFYDFLIQAGLMPNKSKIVGPLRIPDELFADFLRGYFDGDGSVYAYIDRRWKNSYMFYTTFVSASDTFMDWLRANISVNIPGIRGYLRGLTSGVYQLSYAKLDSRVLYKFMYYSESVPRLERKHARYLEIFAEDPYPIRDQGRVVKLVYT
jgi:hypothetical protein